MVVRSFGSADRGLLGARQDTSGESDSALLRHSLRPRLALILGARVADLEMVLARRVRGSCLQGIAVRADLYGSDAGAPDGRRGPGWPG
jgi:hypothetical protein